MEVTLGAMKPLFAAVLVAAAAVSAQAQDITITGPVAAPGEAYPDEFPQPKSRPRVEYPREMRNTDEVGYVIIEHVVDEKGANRSLGAHGSHIALQRAVENEFSDWKMKPALRDGKPVPCSFWQAVIFNPKSAAPDTPTALPRLLTVTPVYTHDRDVEHVGGTVAAKLSIDETGAVTHAELPPSAPPALARDVAIAVKSWRFAPARRNGQAVAAVLVEPVVCLAGSPRVARHGTPPKIVKQEHPVYPIAMRRYGIEASVLVDFVVTTTGEVANATIARSENPGFDTAALKAVRQWKFEPGQTDGRPVATHMQVPVVFRLDGGGTSAFRLAGGDIKKLPEEMQYDTDPTPRNILVPVYPYAMVRDDTSGRAEVLAIFDETGHVARVRVISATRPECGLALCAAAEGFVIDPPLKRGKPVAYMLRIPQDFDSFSLDDDGEMHRLARLEQKHPERIVRANKLDAPLKPVSRRAPVFPTSVAPSVDHGDALVECVINEEGRAILSRVVNASDPAFGYAAVQATNAWWFEPPTQGGKAVVTRVQIPFTFARGPARHPAGPKPPPGHAS